MADTCKNCGAHVIPVTWDHDGMCPGCRNDAAIRAGDLAARLALIDGTDVVTGLVARVERLTRELAIAREAIDGLRSCLLAIGEHPGCPKAMRRLIEDVTGG